MTFVLVEADIKFCSDDNWHDICSVDRWHDIWPDDIWRDICSDDSWYDICCDGIWHVFLIPVVETFVETFDLSSFRNLISYHTLGLPSQSRHQQALDSPSSVSLPGADEDSTSDTDEPGPISQTTSNTAASQESNHSNMSVYMSHGENASSLMQAARYPGYHQSAQSYSMLQTSYATDACECTLFLSQVQKTQA